MFLMVIYIDIQRVLVLIIYDLLVGVCNDQSVLVI
jgi:hypothetical protein